MVSHVATYACYVATHQAELYTLHFIGHGLKSFVVVNKYKLLRLNMDCSFPTPCTHALRLQKRFIEGYCSNHFLGGFVIVLSEQEERKSRLLIASPIAPYPNRSRLLPTGSRSPGNMEQHVVGMRAMEMTTPPAGHAHWPHYSLPSL